jgi:hypothetical protein
MKSRYIYYSLIFLPLLLLIGASKYHYLNANVFVLLLAFYCFLYHPIVSGLRLISLKKIPKSEFWRNFIPFWNLRYFSDLFFN